MTHIDCLIEIKWLNEHVESFTLDSTRVTVDCCHFDSPMSPVATRVLTTSDLAIKRMSCRRGTARRYKCSRLLHSRNVRSIFGENRDFYSIFIASMNVTEQQYNSMCTSCTTVCEKIAFENTCNMTVIRTSEVAPFDRLFLLVSIPTSLSSAVLEIWPLVQYYVFIQATLEYRWWWWWWTDDDYATIASSCRGRPWERSPSTSMRHLVL